MKGRFFIARHGQTVFNAVGRMQGETTHTPLTRTGFAQAEAIGETLAARLGPAPPLELWSSTAGRALQTLAIAAEHLALDWHAARVDARLAEMDMGRWGGRYHRDIEAEEGPFADPERGLLTRCPPGGESFAALAMRLSAWLDDLDGARDRLVVMHGVSSRVLRGLLTGAAPHPACGVAVAPSLPQGSVLCIEDGVETVLARPGSQA